MTTNDDFGAGVFDDDPVEEETTEQEPEPLKLEGRALAIAEGRDPDEVKDEPEEKPEEEEVEEEPAGKQEGEPPKKPEWSRSDRRIAAQFGLKDADLDRFDSQDSLHAALDLLEQQQAKDTTDSSTESSSDVSEDSGAVSDVLGFKKTDVDAVKQQFEAKDEEGNPLFDEDTRRYAVEQAERTRQLEDTVEKLMQQQAGPSSEEIAEQEKAVQELHSTLDKATSLNGDFAKTDADKMSEAHKQARIEVAEHVETLLAGYAARNVEPPSISELTEQSIKVVHGDKLAKAKERASSLKKQSQTRRRPGSKTTASRKRPANTDPHSPEAIANDPDIRAFYEEAQLANGT